MLPARTNSKRLPVSRPKSLPAPTNGWYVGENLADAPPKTAYVMDNWFPSQDSCRFRRGSLEYASFTGFASSPVRQIFSYNSGLNDHIFAALGGGIWDFTGGGEIGAPDIAGFSSDNWQAIQFTTTGGTFLRAVNGADVPVVYDGSNWGTSPAITGVTPGHLAAIWAFKNRVYFAEANTLNAWYLGLDSIGGAATKFPLGSVFTLGGSLVAGASWAISSNSGLYETCVFVSDEGEVAMFDGLYPGDTGWTIKGKYKIGRPLGRDCILKAGGDLAIMTEDGIVPMSKVMTLDRIALTNEAITRPIAPAWRSAVTSRVGLDGWSITTWPLESMALVTLPYLSSDGNVQFVANARSGAWCRYTGWNAVCFAVDGNSLLFGTSDGRVMMGEVGGKDDGALYSGKLFWNFTDLGTVGNRKQIKAARPIFQASYNVAPTVDFNVDFAVETPAPPAPADATAGLGARWDVARWDVDVWPPTVIQYVNWDTASGFGTVIAPVVQVSVSSLQPPELRLQQIDILFETGSALG